MHLIKQFIIGFIGIGIVLFLLSLPLPSTVNVSKSVLVSTPKETVLASVLNLHEWNKWNPLLQDSSIEYRFNGDQQVQWTARDGKTNQIILSQFAADSAFAIITTNNKKAFESGFSITKNEGSNNVTKIDWWIHEELGWLPWNKFYGLFTESLKEEYLDNSMQLLKRHLEKNN